MKAIWNGEIIAESDNTIEIEKNYYFPPDSIYKSYFNESETTSRCHWKGLAQYFNVKVNGEVNEDAAWYYPSPKKEVEQIKDYVAFWHGVKIEE